MTLSYRVNRVLSVIRQAAMKGEPCPPNDEIRRRAGCQMGHHEYPAQLAQQGLGRVEVYGRNNWRVFIFPDGLATAPSPHGGKPYRILDKNGDRRL